MGPGCQPAMKWESQSCNHNEMNSANKNELGDEFSHRDSTQKSHLADTLILALLGLLAKKSAMCTQLSIELEANKFVLLRHICGNMFSAIEMYTRLLNIFC